MPFFFYQMLLLVPPRRDPVAPRELNPLPAAVGD